MRKPHITPAFAAFTAFGMVLGGLIWLTTPSGASGQTLPATATPTSPPAHVVIVVMENHSLSEALPAATYLTGLARQGVLYTDDTGKSHPSLPNYLDLYSGSTQGQDGSDSCVQLSAANLGTQAAAAHLTIKGYMEGLGGGGNYACRHNPFAQFTDPTSVHASVDFSQFPTNYASLPRIAYVSPNTCNDWHDCSIATGDAWLRTHLNGYAQWAKTHNSVLIVTTDENNGNGLTDPLMTVVVGQGVRPSTQRAHVTHDSLLRTLEDWFRLGHLNGSASATPLPGLPRF